jgi:hypothetical protein
MQNGKSNPELIEARDKKDLSRNKWDRDEEKQKRLTKLRCDFFKKVNKINKAIARLIKKKDSNK